MRANAKFTVGLVLVAGAAAIAAASLAQPMQMPARRAGQWQMTMSGSGMPSAMTMTECVDPASEHAFSPFHAGPYGAHHAGGEQACSKRDVHAIAGGWAFESVCPGPGGAPAATSGTVTGDFTSHIHMVVDTKGGSGERRMVMDQTWLGACPAGGGGRTVTLPDGRTITIPQH